MGFWKWRSWRSLLDNSIPLDRQIVMRVMIYTVAVDNPGERIYWHLAKLLVSSLCRSGNSFQIRVFHNGTDPMFPLGRPNVQEFLIESSAKTNTSIENRWALKAKLGRSLCDDSDWEKILFLDADCLVTGSLDTFLSGDWEIACVHETGQPIQSVQFNALLTPTESTTLQIEGVNSGVLGVNRRIAQHFFEAWEKIDRLIADNHVFCRDQAALNRTLLDNHYLIKDCRDMVSAPYHTGFVARAPITHWVGLSNKDKLPPSFGKFMETYFLDEKLTLFNLLEH
jgi:hypothetical protein